MKLQRIELNDVVRIKDGEKWYKDEYEYEYEYEEGEEGEKGEKKEKKERGEIYNGLITYMVKIYISLQ